jgi:hypothetical protein
MISIWFLLACGDGETVELKAEIARLEGQVAAMEMENAGLRRTHKNLEMLEKASAESTSPIEGRCRKGPSGSYFVQPEVIRAVQADPNALIRAGRWIPSLKGSANAWRAVHIRRGGLLASCGFRNGDVLTHVDGSEDPVEWRVRLNQADQLDQIELGLLRGHAKETLVFHLDR